MTTLVLLYNIVLASGEVVNSEKLAPTKSYAECQRMAEESQERMREALPGNGLIRFVRVHCVKRRSR